MDNRGLTPTGARTIDHDRLKEIFGDDEHALRECLDTFLRSVEPLIAQATAAMSAYDSQQLKRLGHTMKGACGRIGADELAALGHELEEIALASDWSRAEQVTNALEESFARTAAAIEAR